MTGEVERVQARVWKEGVTDGSECCGENLRRDRGFGEQDVAGD